MAFNSDVEYPKPVKLMVCDFKHTPWEVEKAGSLIVVQPLPPLAS